MKKQPIKPAKEFTWNGIDCVVLHDMGHSYLCRKAGTTEGYFSVQKSAIGESETGDTLIRNPLINL